MATTTTTKFTIRAAAGAEATRTLKPAIFDEDANILFQGSNKVINITQTETTFDLPISVTVTKGITYRWGYLLVSGGEFFAVGSAGADALQGWTGSEWRPMPPNPTNGASIAVSFVDSGDDFAVGTFNNGNIYRVEISPTHPSGPFNPTGYSFALPTPPVANFSGTPRTGIKTINCQFTDTSTGSPTSWSWKRKVSGSGDAFVEFSTLENPLELFDTDSP
jgi:hypothetical protein